MVAMSKSALKLEVARSERPLEIVKTSRTVAPHHILSGGYMLHYMLWVSPPYAWICSHIPPPQSSRSPTQRESPSTKTPRQPERFLNCIHCLLRSLTQQAAVRVPPNSAERQHRSKGVRVPEVTTASILKYFTCPTRTLFYNWRVYYSLNCRYYWLSCLRLTTYLFFPKSLFFFCP